MFVVLRHTGSYSDYRCEVIGVFTSEEEAKNGIHDLLLEQVEERKREIQESIESRTRDQELKPSKYNLRALNHYKKEQQLLNEGKYDFADEKSTFEILCNLEVNKFRKFNNKDDGFEDMDTSIKQKDSRRDFMIIENSFYFESNIHQKEDLEEFEYEYEDSDDEDKNKEKDPTKVGSMTGSTSLSDFAASIGF